jgi:glycerophosphoryl diester phosphodiesterase
MVSMWIFSLVVASSMTTLTAQSMAPRKASPQIIAHRGASGVRGAGIMIPHTVCLINLH